MQFFSGSPGFPLFASPPASAQRVAVLHFSGSSQRVAKRPPPEVGQLVPEYEAAA